MASQHSTAVIVGSLRKGSFSLKIAKALTRLAPPSLQFDVITLGGLSFYNQDLEATPPADWVSFRERVKKADAVLFVTPEYNRSVPGVLKNAIDVGSRPYGQSVFDGKPGGVISNSPGAIGGFGANHHLRQSLVFLNVPVLQQPEAYVGGIGDAFDENDELVKASLREFLEAYIKAFAAWVVQQTR
ncbi:NADPH-dependent FMN reductase [Nitrobacter hamburgensis X14]|uniref:NADPH-dependent FMN reductase n=1 Tax=Nitrobacter hamburgensis (strain DSM 10229 / NCIMB 13809 / X14) TaxID=323097 RepID=Q1QMI5_NITHX|nr:NADPH-dependent FMN reductase [Nitrobacter hamburgensis]ABE62562.1 NADPH-dependent FMN reductase [Nitrobacter hamburgensis X14]